MEFINFIKSLKKDEIITILPHDNLDVDSFISAVLLSEVLTVYNVQSEILIFDKYINNWTKYFLEKFGFDLSKYFTNDEDMSRKIILVDHYKTKHLGNVIGCIDHHFTLENLNYKYYLYKPACSAAYIIYKYMEKINIPITRKFVELVCYATLVDTCSFKSSKTINSQKEEILNLLKMYDFDVQEMIKECLCLDNLSKMTLDEIVLNGIKEYKYSEKIVKSSYVQIDSLEISNEIIEYIQQITLKENIYMWVFIVSDLIHEKAKIYKITNEDIIIEKYDRIMSRGNDIMPKIEKEILNK